MRLFVALPASENVRQDALRVLEQLKATRADCKWVEDENVHFTLHFYGETPESAIGEMRHILADAASKQPPFKLKLGAAGAFPSATAPKVLWLGVSEGEPEMAKLADSIAVQERPFKAHLTLGRLRSPRHRNALIKALEKASGSAEMTADRIVLMQSKLSSEGPVYSEVASEPLR
jgi:2'-5' RNA ligase